MMIRGFLLGALFIVLGSVPTLACSCARPNGIRGEELKSFRLERASLVVQVKLLDFELKIDPQTGDFLGRSNAVVIKQIKGRVPERITLHSFGGDENGNCGRASLLFEAISDFKLLTVSLLQPEERQQTYWVVQCDYHELGDFGTANGN